MLRKMPFMQGLPRVTIWYCQYGDDRAKPTDIWSNHIYDPMFNPNGWKPRPECWNGREDCHESAPRGSKTGTQGKKDNYDKRYSKLIKGLAYYQPILCLQPWWFLYAATTFLTRIKQ